jgi:hypothetical protein
MIPAEISNRETSKQSTSENLKQNSNVTSPNLLRLPYVLNSLKYSKHPYMIPAEISNRETSNSSRLSSTKL